MIKMSTHIMFLITTGILGCLGLIISALLMFMVPIFGDGIIVKEFRFLIILLPAIPFLLTLSLLVAYLKAGKQKIFFATSIITVALPALITESVILRGNDDFPHFFWYALIALYFLFLLYIMSLIIKKPKEAPLKSN